MGDIGENGKNNKRLYIWLQPPLLRLYIPIQLNFLMSVLPVSAPSAAAGVSPPLFYYLVHKAALSTILVDLAKCNYSQFNAAEFRMEKDRL